MLKSVLTTFIISFFYIIAYSQSQYISELNKDLYFRYEKSLYGDSTNRHTSIRPFIVKDIINYKDVDLEFYGTPKNKFLKYLSNDKFANISYDGDKSNFCLRPIITSIEGYETNTTDTKSLQHRIQLGASANFNYKKKFSVRADIVYFQTAFSEFLTKHHESFRRPDSSEIIPHFGKFLSNSNNVYNYLSFEGYLSYSPSKNFNLQLGNGRNFWGDGYRSLLLSDNSNSYPFFKITVDVWKIKYICMFAQLQDIYTGALTEFDQNGIPSYPLIKSSVLSASILKTKYMASHYLSWAIGKRINLNMFESIIWSNDNDAGKRGIDVNYLNPIIFYRPVEFSLGSPDNAILGGGFSIKIAKNYHLYGQLILDEFLLSEIKARNGWWGNKYGFQIGAKSFDIFNVKGLYVQAEYNYVRPFTYSHQNSMHNYGSYYQPLAHPLGANFKEMIAIAKYDKKRISISVKGIYTQYGSEKDTIFIGHNIYKSYISLREGNTITDGHYTTQGIKTDLKHAELKLSYMINTKLNLVFEVGCIIRQLSVEDKNYNYNYISFGFRTNLFNYSIDY